MTSESFGFTVEQWEGLTHVDVSVSARARADVLEIVNVFDRFAPESKLPEPPPVLPPPTSVFIGHGQSPEWQELRNHLQDLQGFKVIAYETGSRAGHVIRDILDSMLSEATFAVLVMSGDDKTEDGTLRARQNVIHEIGLFQARLGWERAIVLLERGVEDFSNLQGVHHIEYDKGRIRETFGEVVAAIRRESGDIR